MKSDTLSTFYPPICHEVTGLDATFIKKLFSSSSLSTKNSFICISEVVDSPNLSKVGVEFFSHGNTVLRLRGHKTEASV